MMKPLFSIIVPMYNVEQFILRCLNSIFDQNYNTTNFEVILVDDESPDNSTNIARIFLESNGFSNFKIISQKNKGLGGARNTGINNALGDYLVFLDADDVLNFNVLECIEQEVLSIKFDICEFGANILNENMNITSVFKPNQVITPVAGTSYFLKEKSIPSVCNKIYRTSFIREKNLLFRERLYIEDFEFNTRAFFYAQNVISTNSIILEGFVQTQNSITRNKNNETKNKLVQDLFIVSAFVKSFAEQHASLSDMYFRNRLARLNTNQLYQAYKYQYSATEIKNIINVLKKRELYYLDTPIKPIRRNLFRIFIYRVEFLFLLIVKLKNER